MAPFSVGRPPSILTIAASYPTGTEGAQADLKTFAAHHVHGMAVITAVSCETTVSVGDLHVVPTEFVEKQLNAVVGAVPLNCVKTGMLPTKDHISIVAMMLARNSMPCVVDPVISSKSGETLLTPSATNAFLTELLPCATIATPNLRDALLLAELSGRDFGKLEGLTPETRLELAIFLASKAQWILLKGSQASIDQAGMKTTVDILANSSGQTYEFAYENPGSLDTHGTDCTLASAIAANIALGHDMVETVRKATDFVQGAVQNAYSLGKGNRAINHLYRQRSLPFTPGKFYDYLLNHPRIKDVWHEFTHHTFVYQLSQGTLPLSQFRQYLVQDYHFLKHFSRAIALGAYKSTSFSTISNAANTLSHIQTEVKLHKTLCAEYGVPEEELEHGEEDLACVAYTRWVTDIGTSEDWFGLQVSMLPCILGYGAIARRLFDDDATVRDGNPYFRWIENYVSPDYVEAVNEGKLLLEENAVKLSPERVDEIVEIFREGSRLECFFWPKTLSHHCSTSMK